jgi:O-antigen/teichoic acid export membrane protein
VSTTLPQLVRSAGGQATRRIVRDPSSALLLAQLVAAGGALVANILTARALGPTGRGELTLLLQIAYSGSLAVLLGCERSVVAVYTGHPVRAVTRAFVQLLLRPSLVSLVIAAAIIALPLPFLDSWHVRLAFAALFMVVNAFCRAARAIAIASGRTRQYLFVAMGEEVIRLGALVLLFLLGRADSAAYLLAHLLAGLVTSVGLLWWWSRSHAAGGRPTSGSAEPATADEVDAARDRALRGRARIEGLHLLPATVAHSGTLRIDRFLLPALASTAALGLYAPVATFTELIVWPLLAFTDSRLGVWRQAHDRGALDLRRVIFLGAAYTVVAAGLMAGALLVLLEPLLGPDFAAARPLVVPLSIAAGVFGISQLLVNALTAVRRNRLSSVAEVAGLTALVVACVPLIGRFGALGAAYGSLIGYSVCGGLAALFLARARRSRPATPPPAEDATP